MVCNDWLAQDLADMLELTVERPAFIETTRSARPCSPRDRDLSTAEAAAAMRGAVTHFEPAMDDLERERRLAGWKEALGKADLLADGWLPPISAKGGRRTVERSRADINLKQSSLA
jgi:glycerol kinase